MNITASMVKELRDRTGAGMMDSKKALQENNGDFEASIDWLRTKGIAKAEKKASRVASEGKVVTLTDANKGVMIEVNSETDFVAKNEQFIAFTDELAKLALTSGETDVEAIMAMNWPEGGTVTEKITGLVATIGENISLRRVVKLEVAEGVVMGYSHMGGKIGVLVALNAANSDDKTSETAKNIAMHVAASNPQFLDRSSIDADVLARETAVYEERARQGGKPEEIVQKIVTGQVNKFCEEICLVDQAFVMDTDRKVGQVASDSNATISEYVRFGLGEGIEKKSEDFAAEVASVVNA